MGSLQMLKATSGQALSAPTTAADEILAFARALAGEADNVAATAGQRLASVMHPASPQAGCEEKAPEYPPLFDELRSQLWCIQSALGHIQDCLCRTELPLQ